MKKEIEIINHEYMMWVEKFLQDKGNFSSDFLKNRNLFSKHDINNIKKLEMFFRLVETYAAFNNIDPIIYDGSSFIIKNFCIRDNDKLYNIGYLSEQETIFTFSELSIPNNTDIIDFKDFEKFQLEIQNKKNRASNLKDKELVKIKTRRRY